MSDRGEQPSEHPSETGRTRDASNRPAPRSQTRTVMYRCNWDPRFVPYPAGGRCDSPGTQSSGAGRGRPEGPKHCAGGLRGPSAEPASEADLTLAATTQAIQDAIIYARTSGYLRKRYVDIGDQVKAGQLLAEIESPEIDQQLRQAQADLRQSEKNLDLQKANLDLARITMARYKAADAEGAVAKQAVDQNVAAYRTAQAAVAAAEANVHPTRPTSSASRS